MNNKDKPYLKLEMPDGSESIIGELNEGDTVKIITQKQRDRLQHIASQDDFRVAIKEACGSFVFQNYERLLRKAVDKRTHNIDYALLFRFLYLSTYSDYRGYLMYGSLKNGKEHMYMEERDLSDVLKLSKASITSLRPQLYKMKLLQKEGDRLKINPKYCIRGNLPESCRGDTTRVFDDGIRYIYENSKPTEHKRLGMAIALLPYMNIHNNIICTNPEEPSLDYTLPLSMEDICQVVNYDYANATHLRKILTSLEFNGYGIVAYISHSQGEFFVMNPCVFFKGVSFDDLSGIAEVFNVQNRKDNKQNVA